MEQVWNNISVGEFVEIRAILKDADRDSWDKQVALAALLQGITEEELLNLPLDKATEVFGLLNGLDRPPKRSRIRQLYRVGRWTLKVTQAQEMTVAQWVDFQQYGRDMDRNLVEILSVALVPVGKTYNTGYDIGELKNDIRSRVMIPDALAVCFFFQRRWLQSMRRSLTYLIGWTTLKGWTKAKNKALQVRREISAILRSL